MVFLVLFRRRRASRCGVRSRCRTRRGGAGGCGRALGLQVLPLGVLSRPLDRRMLLDGRPG